MEKRSHIIQCIRNFKNIENQVNLDINRIARNNFQLIRPKVTCVIINDNNNQLINSQEEPEKSEIYNLAYKFKEKIKIWAIKSEEEAKKYWTIMFPEEY